MRLRGFFAAAAFGLAAGAVGGFILFAPVPADRRLTLQALLPVSTPRIQKPAPSAVQAAPPDATQVAPPPEVVPPPSIARGSVSTTASPSAAPTQAPATAEPIVSIPSPTPRIDPPAPQIEQPATLASAAAPPAPSVAPAEPAPAALDPALLVAPDRIDVSRAAAPAAAATPAAMPPDETAAIDAVLDRYQAAYGNRDAAAVKQLWPSANQAALAKAFADLESQNLAFYSCKTAVDGSTARVSCGGQMSYVARVGGGNSRTQHRDWTFRLSRNAADNWKIDGVEIR